MSVDRKEDNRLRIIVHDYAGHPFPVELSRELARRRHHVLHLHCPAYTSGKGALRRYPEDAATFRSEAVPLAQFDKHAPVRRMAQELRYGQALGRRIREESPNVVLSANTPLFAQALALRATASCAAPFVFWLQDLTSLAASRFLESRVPLGLLLTRPLRTVEQRLLDRSDAVVAISDDFRRILASWDVVGERVHVIENWAPLGDLPEVARDNHWAEEHNLAGRRVLLYSGTLGLKHNPALLVALAQRLRLERDVSIVVVSEGVGADQVAAAKRRERLDNLVVLPFQPFARLPEVLGSATVLVSILERDAGVFAVPSKVLSYLCAGRPILGAMPAENLASRTVALAHSGVIVDPDDTTGFVDAAAQLLAEPGTCAKMGRAARRYAVATFEISTIADRFEAVFEQARAHHQRRRHRTDTH